MILFHLVGSGQLRVSAAAWKSQEFVNHCLREHAAGTSPHAWELKIACGAVIPIACVCDWHFWVRSASRHGNNRICIDVASCCRCETNSEHICEVLNSCGCASKLLLSGSVAPCHCQRQSDRGRFLSHCAYFCPLFLRKPIRNSSAVCPCDLASCPGSFVLCCNDEGGGASRS